MLKSISECFIKSFFNDNECNDIDGELFELPARNGGLQESKISDCEYENIKKLMQQGTELIIKQQLFYDVKYAKFWKYQKQHEMLKNKAILGDLEENKNMDKVILSRISWI